MWKVIMRMHESTCKQNEWKCEMNYSCTIVTTNFTLKTHTQWKQKSRLTNPKFCCTILEISSLVFENESLVTLMALKSRFFMFLQNGKFWPEFWHFGLEIAWNWLIWNSCYNVCTKISLWNSWYIVCNEISLYSLVLAP